MVIVSGCAGTRTVVLDSNRDWVKTGKDVKGHVYIYNTKTDSWELSKDVVTLPEGWVAGPEPKE